MRDFFSQAFQPNQQGETNAFGSNPNTLSLAGLLQAQGVPQDKAYIMAAGINNERQVSQGQQQKLAYDQNQQMQRMQALQGLQGLSQGGEVDQNALNQQLFSGAFSPGEISSLRDVLNPQVDEKEVFNKENKLRDEYIAQSKDFKIINDAYPRILASAQDPSPAGDMSIIFNYMKMLDPGSTVREGEYATAANAGSIPDRYLNTYNKVISGEKLTPKQREDFVALSGKLYTSQYRNQNALTKKYETLASRYKVDPKNVTIDYRAEGFENPKGGVFANPQQGIEGMQQDNSSIGDDLSTEYLESIAYGS